MAGLNYGWSQLEKKINFVFFFKEIAPVQHVDVPPHGRVFNTQYQQRFYQSTEILPTIDPFDPHRRFANIDAKTGWLGKSFSP
jgi:hypothetical protein